MRSRRTRFIVLVCAASALCGLALGAAFLGPRAWAQPAAAPVPEEPVGIDHLHRQLMQDLVQALSQVHAGVREDPEFLDTDAAEILLARVEAIGLVARHLHTALQPDRPRAGPEANGRFQFVEWIEPDARYWVLDTRTGALGQREAPPMEER